MPIEIGEVEVVANQAPTTPVAPTAAAPAASSGAGSPSAVADQLRAWHRELAYRADRLRAD
jgi:hypothetical protein